MFLRLLHQKSQRFCLVWIFQGLIHTQVLQYIVSMLSASSQWFDQLYTHRSHVSRASLHAAPTFFPHFTIIVSSIMSCFCFLDCVSARAQTTAGALFIFRRKSKSALLMMFFNPHSSSSPHADFDNSHRWRASKEIGSVCHCS